MQRSLTKGPITSSILLFALPLMLGNLLQQMYNIADTWVVGRFLGADALAAVGSSYTLMTFLTSILLGLCMGSGAAISMQYGSGEQDRMRQSVFLSFVLIAGISLVLNVLVYLGLEDSWFSLPEPSRELSPSSYSRERSDQTRIPRFSDRRMTSRPRFRPCWFCRMRWKNNRQLLAFRPGT